MVKRRQYTPEFKRELVELTRRPGTSVAGIALAHEINANQLHRWRRQLLGIQRPAGGALLPVTVVAEAPRRQASPVENSHTIDIELPRARLSIRGAVDLAVLQTVVAALHSR